MRGALGTRSKAKVMRVWSPLNGIVPCHMYEGNSTSMPGFGSTKCSASRAGEVGEPGLPKPIQPSLPLDFTVST